MEYTSIIKLLNERMCMPKDKITWRQRLCGTFSSPSYDFSDYEDRVRELKNILNNESLHCGGKFLLTANRSERKENISVILPTQFYSVMIIGKNHNVNIYSESSENTDNISEDSQLPIMIKS